MISTLLLAALVVVRPAQDALEIGRARAILLAAHRGIDPTVLVPSPSLAVEHPQVEDEPSSGTRMITFGDCWLLVDPRTGLVVSYNGDDDRERKYGPREDAVPRHVSDDQAVALARRLFAATGQPYGIKINPPRDHEGNHGENIRLDFVPVWRGLPYDPWQLGWIDLDREDGRVKQYNFHALSKPLVAPPPSLVPRVSPAEARLAALRVAVGSTAEALTESSVVPLALCIGEPYRRGLGPASGIWSFLSPDEDTRVEAGQGTLVYFGTFDRNAGVDGRERPRVDVRVDALTGRVLDLRDWSVGMGGGGPKVAGKPLPVPASARAWRVGVGRDPWTSPATAALTPAAQPVPTKGTKLALTDGKAAFPALYDPATGLVAISGKAYRPGSALAALLKRRAKG